MRLLSSSRSSSILAGAVFALFAGSSVAGAAIISADSFVVGSGAYVATNLTSQPANNTSPLSSGFSSAFGSGATGFLQPATTSLTYTAAGYSVPETSGSVRLFTNTTVGAGGSRSLTRSIANSAANPNTLYFSGLIQAGSALGANRAGFFEFSSRGPSGDPTQFLGATNEGFEFGIQDNAFVLNTVGGPTLQTYSTAGAYAPRLGPAATSTNLFIIKLELVAGGNDIFTIYLNPTDVTSEAAAITSSGFSTTVSNLDAAVSGSIINSFGFRTMSNGTATPDIFADEVRIGTAFADVVSPVPEPNSAMLIGGGVALLGLVRRKR